jgi:hypothetical protein
LKWTDRNLSCFRSSHCPIKHSWFFFCGRRFTDAGHPGSLPTSSRNGETTSENVFRKMKIRLQVKNKWSNQSKLETDFNLWNFRFFSIRSYLLLIHS